MMKKLIFVAAFIVSVLLICVGAVASERGQIGGINEAYWQDVGFPGQASLNGEPVLSLTELELRPGARIEVTLPAVAFVNGQDLPMDTAAVTPSQLREAGIELKSRITAGNQAISEIKLKSGDADVACIVIDFAEEFPFTKEAVFEVQLYLSAGDRRREATEFIVSGKISNAVIRISGDDREVDLSNGDVAEAVSYVKDIDVHIGNGVSILSSFFEGTRYYGTSEVQTADMDDLLFALYPEISLMYNLRTIGLKRDGRDVVTFDLPEIYYVYDNCGDYIGTTEKPLPYSSVYYLATVNIERIDLPD